MKFKVISPFRDKYNLSKIYQVGETFESEDEVRIKDLLDRKLIDGEGASENDAPSFPIADQNELQLMTKKELMDLLKQKKIPFNSRQTKEELIQLLGR